MFTFWYACESAAGGQGNNFLSWKAVGSSQSAGACHGASSSLIPLLTFFLFACVRLLASAVILGFIGTGTPG